MKLNYQLPCILWLMTTFPALCAADIGLYELSDNARPIKPLPGKVERAILSSRSNDNSVYHLTLIRSAPFSINYQSIGLVAGEKVIAFSGSGFTGDSASTNYSIQAVVDDAAVVRQIIEHFKPEVQLRKHPGYQLMTTFVPEKESFVPGEPVMVKLRIANVGQADFTFRRGSLPPAGRDIQFAFSGTIGATPLSDVGEIPKPWWSSGDTRYITLRPGDHHDINVDLKQWFAFSAHGIYELRGSYRMHFADTKGHGYATWQDFASAEFRIKVSAPRN